MFYQSDHNILRFDKKPYISRPDPITLYYRHRQADWRIKSYNWNVRRKYL